MHRLRFDRRSSRRRSCARRKKPVGTRQGQAYRTTIAMVFGADETDVPVRPIDHAAGAAMIGAFGSSGDVQPGIGPGSGDSPPGGCYPARMDRRPDLASPPPRWRWAGNGARPGWSTASTALPCWKRVHGRRVGARSRLHGVMSCGIAALGLLRDSGGDHRRDADLAADGADHQPRDGPGDVRPAHRARVAHRWVGVALALAIAIPLVWLSPLQEATGEILAHPPDLLRPAGRGAVRPRRRHATITRKGGPSSAWPSPPR